MAIIVVTQAGTTVAVKNGDRVVIDIPGGGDVTIVAANANARNFRIDFGDDDTVDDTATVDLSTFSRDGLQIQAVGYDPDDRLSLQGATNKQIDENSTNVLDFDFGSGLSGSVKILDPGERDLNDTPPPILICFTEGTAIETDLGARPVESLVCGDLVRTLDHGLQPVRWIGQRSIGVAELAEDPGLQPIRIAAGALGGGLPWKDLLVSPQHRILVSDWRSEVLYGRAEVLVPAKAMVGAPGISVATADKVTYLHILFDRHELVWSDGILSESLHPGEMTRSALGPEAFHEIERVVERKTEQPITARTALRVSEARALIRYAA